MAHTEYPLATLVVLFYKHERFVEDTVAGALSQTYPNLEIIFSDDNSPDGTFEVLPKKEVAALQKEWDKLEKNLGGIKNMKRLPDAIFVVDPKKEHICVQEARTLGITLIGICDTNCDPEELDYVIPGNDDAIRAVKLIVSKMADAVIEANQGEQYGTAAANEVEAAIDEVEADEAAAEENTEA